MGWIVLIIIAIILSAVFDGMGKYIKLAFAFVVAAGAFLLLFQITKMDFMVIIAKICGSACILVSLFAILKRLFFNNIEKE